MSAPLVVNTDDGTVWTRREATRDGLALYAPEKCPGCPEFVMATYAELEGHGVAGAADVLPMPVPVGPEPQALSSEQHAQIAELIGAAKPATDQLLLEMAQQIRDRREHDHSTAADWDWYCLNASGWLGDKAPTVLRRLLDAEARVAELEAERHSTNEALDDAVQALRAEQGQSYPPALPWARLMDDEDLHDFLDELAASAITHASNARALAEVEDTIARWRVIGEAQHGHNTAPGPDAVTTSFAERAGRETDSGRRAAWRMLAQDMAEGEHFAAVHHDYRVSHDLPETGGVQ